MLFTIIFLCIAVVVLGIIIWQDQQTIQRLQSTTQSRLVTTDRDHGETTVAIPILEQLQRALPGSLWVISVPHAHHGHLVYTAVMKEPTSPDQQLQNWASRNVEPLNPLDPNHRKALYRMVNTIFQKVKDGAPLTWIDQTLIRIGYDLHVPYPDIEQGYRDFVAGTIRDPASSGTMDGLQALRSSAAKTTLKKTHFDLPSFKGEAD